MPPEPDAGQVLAARLSLADELERYRLARSVHDGLCQTLNLVSLQLGMAQRCAQAEDVKAMLAETGQLIQEAGRSAQKLMSELSPPVLHVLGLLPAVRWLGEQVEEKHGLKVQVEDDGAPKELDEAANVLAFRAVRELIANVAIHARAPGARVDLRRAGEELVVSVEDCGVGFDVAAAELQSTRGLRAVVAWMAYLGGRVDVQSSSGKGTTITLTVPAGSGAGGFTAETPRRREIERG